MGSRNCVSEGFARALKLNGTYSTTSSVPELKRYTLPQTVTTRPSRQHERSRLVSKLDDVFGVCTCNSYTVEVIVNEEGPCLSPRRPNKLGVASRCYCRTSDCIESLLGSILQGPPPMTSPLSATEAILRYQSVLSLLTLCVNPLERGAFHPPTGF
jgi:hypothetical protein